VPKQCVRNVPIHIRGDSGSAVQIAHIALHARRHLAFGHYPDIPALVFGRLGEVDWNRSYCDCLHYVGLCWKSNERHTRAPSPRGITMEILTNTVEILKNSRFFHFLPKVHSFFKQYRA